MRKLWYVFSLLAVASVLLAACQPAATATTAAPQPTTPPQPTAEPDLLADIQAKGVIRISTDANYAPQSFLRPDGEFEGFDIDVAREIADRLGVEVEFVTPAWDVITAGSWADQWDISVGSMTVTTARQEVLHFTQPYYYTPAQFAAANGSGINDLEDIAGQAVCVGVATTYESWLLGDMEGLGLPAESIYAEAPADVTVIPLETDNECVQSIQAGREEFQVLLTSSTVVEGTMAGGAPIYKVGAPVYSENLAVAIDRGHSKDPTSLVRELDQIIGLMHADGTLSELSTTWFEADLTVDPTKIEVPAVTIGSEANPIKVLFVPSVDAQVITAGGEIMAEALHEATGLFFEVSVPTSYAATIEEMCASPDNSMGFIPGLGYVLANQLCGVDVAFKAVRFGWDVYWAQVLVPRESDIDSLEDLNGLKWAYPDAGSTSGYMAPLAMFDEAGVEPGETVEAGGHTGAVRALYNGEADFATTFYSPPLKPEGETPWAIGDDPEIPDDLIASCAPNEDASRLMCGDWRVLDARAGLREEAPDVVQALRILTISPEIPNDTLSFGPDFPADLRAQIEAALVAFAETEAWDTSIGSQDFYGWTGLSPSIDEEFDPIRAMVAVVGLTLEDLGQ